MKKQHYLISIAVLALLVFILIPLVGAFPGDQVPQKTPPRSHTITLDITDRGEIIANPMEVSVKDGEEVIWRLSQTIIDRGINFCIYFHFRSPFEELLLQSTSRSSVTGTVKAKVPFTTSFKYAVIFFVPGTPPNVQPVRYPRFMIIDPILIVKP